VARLQFDPLWFQRFFEYHCGDCGSDVGFRSRPRSFSERYLLPLFLLQPVRCGECYHRDYRPIFQPVPERPSRSLESPVAKPASRAVAAPGTRNVA
jgi:hypothetical protein